MVSFVTQKESADSKLASCLFGKTRRAPFGLLLMRPDEAFYLREIVRRCGVGLGAVQRELAEIVEAGIVERTVRGRQVRARSAACCQRSGRDGARQR